jgi:hypothetical protein
MFAVPKADESFRSKKETTMTLDRKIVNNITDDMTVAVQDVAKKHGVVIKFKSGTFSLTNATVKFTVDVIDAEKGVANSQERKDYQRLAAFHGLSPDWLDQAFTVSGAVYTVIGLRPRSYKFPVIVRRISNGKLFKFPISTVKSAFSNSHT